jgi:hypothetical protein
MLSMNDGMSGARWATPVRAIRSSIFRDSVGPVAGAAGAVGLARHASSMDGLVGPGDRAVDLRSATAVL